jgi:hypothetical protein
MKTKIVIPDSVSSGQWVGKKFALKFSQLSVAAVPVTPVVLIGPKQEEPERKLRPIELRDGVLVCDKCGELMSPQGGIGETLVAYRSPPGHDHNDNCLSQKYTCQQGHERIISRRRRCPVCDWTGRDVCFCHDSTKVDNWPKAPDGDQGGPV